MMMIRYYFIGGACLEVVDDGDDLPQVAQGPWAVLQGDGPIAVEQESDRIAYARRELITHVTVTKI